MRKLGQLLLEGEHLCQAWVAHGDAQAVQALVTETAWQAGRHAALAEAAAATLVVADAAMAELSAAVPDWSGGTRLGEQLQAFLVRWGRRGVARGAVVVICSDGWERGDVTLLAEQLEQLGRLAYRVVWVNPHRGLPGFEPRAAGMAAALPYVDTLVAGHSLAAFEELAQALSERGGTRA